jgi:hypothetical protein
MLVDTLFLVLAMPKDRICEIKKIEHFWCLTVMDEHQKLNFGVGCLYQSA